MRDRPPTPARNRYRSSKARSPSLEGRGLELTHRGRLARAFVASWTRETGGALEEPQGDPKCKRSGERCREARRGAEEESASKGANADDGNYDEL
jgi:hypothetical protein